MTLTDSLETELFDVDWRERAQTMLMTTGILAVGWMLGVQYMTIQARNAVPTLALLGRGPSIKQPYEQAMLVGTAVAAIALCAAVLIEFRRRDNE